MSDDDEGTPIENVEEIVEPPDPFVVEELVAMSRLAWADVKLWKDRAAQVDATLAEIKREAEDAAVRARSADADLIRVVGTNWEHPDYGRIERKRAESTIGKDDPDFIAWSIRTKRAKTVPATLADLKADGFKVQKDGTFKNETTGEVVPGLQRDYQYRYEFQPKET